MKTGNLSIIITEHGSISILVRHLMTLKNLLIKMKRTTFSQMIGKQQTTRMEKFPSRILRPKFTATLMTMMMISNRMLTRNI